MISIKTPIWATRSIGIAEHKLHEGENEVEILYKDQSGQRLYPGTFTVLRNQAMRCPVQIVKNVRLRIIPIANLTQHTEIK